MSNSGPNSTITLSRTVDYVRRFIRLAPLTFSGTNDPAMMMADWVRGFMLAPPFSWRWNRGVLPATMLTPGVQDYTLNLPAFGWLEQAAITDLTIPASYQLDISLDQQVEVVLTQPTKVTANTDDSNGNIGFRFMGSPDLPYQFTGSFQLASPTFTSLNDTWNPIPDYLQHVYTTGLLAKAYEYIGDERFAATIQMFVRQLAAFSGGLLDSQVAIFLDDKITSQITSQSMIGASETGLRGRTLS